MHASSSILRPPSLKAAKAPAKPLRAGRSRFGLRRKPGRRAVVETIRCLAVMIDARLPLVDSLTVAARQTEDHGLRVILDAVRGDISRGVPLSVALSSHQAFGALAIQLVRVGESTGLLGDVLLRLADHLEKAEGLRRQVRQALIYPAFVLSVAAAATAFLLAFVVPTFADLYRDFDTELPGPTLLVLRLSNGAIAYAPLAFLLAAPVVMLVRRGVRTSAGRMRLHGLLLALPVVGPLIRLSLAASFSRTLSTLLTNGVPLAEALRLLQSTAENAILSRELDQLARAIERGDGLARSLPRLTLFPPVLVQLAAVGEATGELGDVLARAAAHYEAELEAGTLALSSLLEPILIVIIGVILGGILVAMYLPLFDLVTVMGV
jgi:type IV pilus assembly protein PilC